MTRKPSRRDFIRGKSAPAEVAGVLGDALPGRGEPGRARPAADEGYVVRVARRAMACEFEVRLVAGRRPGDTEVAVEALDLVDALEDQLSFFRPGSDIARINREAAAGPVAVEPRLLELIELALRLYRETDGALDITATPLWEVWGFARRAGAVPSDAQLAEARRWVGSHLVELDRVERTIRFRQPGVRLNLGSMGKGYALDRSAERLVAAGIADFLLHGGYSSVLARGSQNPPPGGSVGGPPPGWVVGIRHPMRPQRRLAEIRLRDRALGTSGSWAQSFVHQGRRYGHIFDPRTGWPAEGVLSATAIAPTAVLADALSTAFYVQGPRWTQDYCRPRPGIAAVLLLPTRGRGGAEIEAIGLGEGELAVL